MRRPPPQQQLSSGMLAGPSPYGRPSGDLLLRTLANLGTTIPDGRWVDWALQLAEHRAGQPAQHVHAPDLGLEQRDHRADLTVETLANGAHVLVLHGQPVAHELGAVGADDGLVDAHID